MMTLFNSRVNLQSEISNYVNGTNDNPGFIEIRERNTRFIYIYSVVIIAIAITALGRAFALFLFLRKVSVNLHKQMFRQVINATMKFFDNNPLGNILNRFSKDLETIDERIPYVVHHIIAVRIR
jgi:ATP-binding cassette subfamily C (CFTR/MRP) protein 4